MLSAAVMIGALRVRVFVLFHSGSSTTGRNSTGSTPEYETSPPSPGHRVQGRRTVSESTAQFSIQDLPENSNVEESWENLKEVWHATGIYMHIYVPSNVVKFTGSYITLGLV